MEGCGAGIINRPDKLPPPEEKEKKSPFVLFYVPELSFLFLIFFFFYFLTHLVADRSQGRFQDMHHPQWAANRSGKWNSATELLLLLLLLLVAFQNPGRDSSQQKLLEQSGSFLINERDLFDIFQLGSQLWTRHLSSTFPPGNRQRRFPFSHSATSLSGVSTCHRLTHPQNHFPWKINYVGFCRLVITAKFQTLTISTWWQSFKKKSD